jgi:hypothetical protein
MSFDWFNMDVFIALVAATAQAVTGILGWRVTVHGVPHATRKKKIYESIFVFATICGIIAAVAAAHRSANLVGQIHAKMHVDQFGFLIRSTLPNPLSLITGQPVAGQPLAGVGKSTNRGGLPAQHFRVACELTISPILDPSAEDRLFDQLEIDQKARLKQPNLNEVLQGDNQDFGCATKDNIPLTDDQIKELRIGMKDGKPEVVYLMILMQYTDKLGEELVTENCGHFQMNMINQRIDCLNHNR